MSGESNLEIVVSKRPSASSIQGQLAMRYKNGEQRVENYRFKMNTSEMAHSKSGVVQQLK